uniref:WD repeat-containing protein 91 n=1 Tax=Gouania willdenowi TaxID=441366 RepID=A0A8C5DM60_GOUWI
MASAVECTDENVREYLLYRGFTSTLKHLDNEIKADKEKGFRVDKIIDQLQQFVQSFDLFGMKEYWRYLDRRLFCRLEDVYKSTVTKLRTSLYRYYVINTIQKGNVEKTQEFFQKQVQELQGQAEWRDWFILPFVPSPEQNPTFSVYFSRQWADTFLVSLHNFLSVLFQCIFDADVQKMIALTDENEQLRQMLFTLQTENPEQRNSDQMVHHKLPLYVQNMDRLGDTELVSCFQKAVQVKEGLPASGQISTSETGSSQQQQQQCSNQSTNQGTNHKPRNKRIQEHEKERKELFSKPPPQTPEKKVEVVETEPPPETCTDPPESSTSRTNGAGADGGGLSAEQPFIKLSQEEYGEHHSSIMHCRVDCSGRRVASLDVDGVVKVWSFNPIMQTKATIMSKSPLLSLEWATKPDRLLLLGSGVGTVRLYDTEAKKNLYEMNIDDTHPRILSLACSPSGSSFVCSAAAPNRSGNNESASRLPIPASGQLLLWDTKTVKQQLQFSLEPEPVAINCTAFNHNGNLLVTGAADGVIRLFDMQQYDSIMSWRAHDGEVYSVEFSYDENTVFSIGEDGKFIQWNIHRCGVKQSEQLLPQDATGPFVLSGYSGYKQVQVPRGRLFAFDSEGQHALTCSSSGGLIYRLTNRETALERVMALGGHKAPVVTVDWCSAVDCGTCLTASMDGKIKLSTLLAQKS